MPKSRLVELFAQHLGVIEEARVSFGPQFNVITGETGAGKTLLLGALELSLGGDHASSRYAVTSESRGRRSSTLMARSRCSFGSQPLVGAFGVHLMVRLRVLTFYEKGLLNSLLSTVNTIRSHFAIGRRS